MKANPMISMHPINPQNFLRTLLALLCTVLAGLAFVPQASAQSGPRINDFDVQQVRSLTPGTELNFTVQGSAGGRASVHIDGVNRNVVLEEIRSGVYYGTYVVSNRDSVRPDAAATATLAQGNQTASATLDTALVQGVRLRATARIQSFEANLTSELRGGNEIPFTLVGTPGGQASVVLQGVPGRVLLDEVRPGQYAGAYTIRNSDRLNPGTPVTATLRVGDRVATQALGRPLVVLAPPPPPAPLVPACAECGVVEVVRTHEDRSGSNAVGTIAGGVLGAIVGSQIGQGRGTTAAEIAGAAAGAYAGNRIQNNMNRKVTYEVVVRLQSGAAQSVMFEQAPAFKAGDKVRLVNGTLQFAAP